MLGASDGTCNELGAVDSNGGAISLAALRLLRFTPPATDAAAASTSTEVATALTAALR
jgi:hypothetical protein